MRIVTHTKLVRRNRQAATWLFLVTLLLLIGGFFFINIDAFGGPDPFSGVIPPELILLLQTMILPLAFALTLFSVRMTNLWARPPRPEKAIPEGLKGLHKSSILYNYYHFPARHVLICPQGVFAIVTRWHDGQFTIKGERFKSHKGAISRFLSMVRMDGIGFPTWDAERAANHVQKQLKDIAPDVEVKPLVVFVEPNVELTIEEAPPVPVIFAHPKRSPNLTEFMRDINRDEQEAQEAQEQQAKRSKKKDKKPSKKPKAPTLPLTDEQIEAFEAATLK